MSNDNRNFGLGAIPSSIIEKMQTQLNVNRDQISTNIDIPSKLSKFKISPLVMSNRLRTYNITTWDSIIPGTNETYAHYYSTIIWAAAKIMTPTPGSVSYTTLTLASNAFPVVPNASEIASWLKEQFLTPYAMKMWVSSVSNINVVTDELIGWYASLLLIVDPYQIFNWLSPIELAKQGYTGPNEIVTVLEFYSLAIMNEILNQQPNYVGYRIVDTCKYPSNTPGYLTTHSVALWLRKNWSSPMVLTEIVQPCSNNLRYRKYMQGITTDDTHAMLRVLAHWFTGAPFLTFDGNTPVLNWLSDEKRLNSNVCEPKVVPFNPI